MDGSRPGRGASGTVTAPSDGSGITITKVETVGLSFVPPDLRWDARLALTSRETLLVRVSTSEGVMGTGECAVFGGALRAVESVVREQLAPLVTGHDPLLREALWQRMYGATVHLGRAGVVMAAISGIDIALWDIAGKIAGLPVYRLLGGMRDEMTAYASGGFYRGGNSVEELIDEVMSYRSRGFNAAKMKVGALSPREDAKRVAAVRGAVGDDFDLMVDANCGYSWPEAVRLAELIKDMGVLWMEEPVRVDDIEGSIEVARRSAVPVAGYESESSGFVFKTLIERNAVHIVQADAIWAGGISGLRKIADMAYAHHKPFVPHVFSSAVALAANMHVLAASGNGGPLEFDGQENPLRDSIVDVPLRPDSKGRVRVPMRAGLGVELDWDGIAKLSVG